METDRHYFFEGLFIIVLSIGVAFGFVWLSKSGRHDDVLYRIRFDESVSGLALGDPVKFRGVDIGTVEKMSLDPNDPQLVQVDVSLRKSAPVRTDTKATLRLKGITGTEFIELSGGSTDAQMLAAATPEGRIPEIPAQKSTLATAEEALPKAIDRFLALEDRLLGLESQTRRVLSDVGATTNEIKQHPQSLIFGRSKGSGSDSEEKNAASKSRTPPRREGKG